MLINKLGRCLTRLDNVYFANNEQASLAVFTAEFCFTHAENNLIQLKLYNNWSAQAVNGVCYVKFKETNQICSPLKISQSNNAE